MHSLKLSCVVGTLLLAAACGSSKSDSKAKEGEAAAKVESKTEAKEQAKPSTPETKPEEKPVAPKEAAVEEETIDPAHMEQDPNATSVVKAHDFKGKLPEGIEKDQLNGSLTNVVGWTDKYGMQAVIFGLSLQEKEEENSALLVADFMQHEGDGSWTSQHQFKASVDKCMFDVELGAQTGSWSVTDLDSNGLAEVSFAWSVGCRSDVSPVKHKVFIVGNDGDGAVQKYVLRGMTAIDIAGDIEGGEFKADGAFAKMPKSYLEHATKVWKETSVEKMN